MKRFTAFRHNGAVSKRSLRRALALLLGCLLALSLAEASARLFSGSGDDWLLVNSPAWYDTSIFQADRELGQVLRPDTTVNMGTPEFRSTVRINSVGLRGPELGEKTRPRLLTIGDSFTLALQVDEEDSFQARLSEALDMEVLNAGVDGYGVHRALRMARRHVEQDQIDAVLLVLFLGNDIGDTAGFHHEGYRPTPQLPSRLTRADRLFGWSALYFHAVAWQKARHARHDPRISGQFKREARIFRKGMDLAAEVAPTLEALALFSQDCKSWGVPCRVALAPPSFVIDEQRALATFDTMGMPEVKLDLGAPARLLLEQTPAELRPFDLTPALAEANPEGPVYLRFDGHWTVRGHQVVGETLGAELQDLR